MAVFPSLFRLQRLFWSATLLPHYSQLHPSHVLGLSSSKHVHTIAIPWQLPLPLQGLVPSTWHAQNSAMPRTTRLSQMQWAMRRQAVMGLAPSTGGPALLHSMAATAGPPPRALVITRSSHATWDEPGPTHEKPANLLVTMAASPSISVLPTVPARTPNEEQVRVLVFHFCCLFCILTLTLSVLFV